MVLCVMNNVEEYVRDNFAHFWNLIYCPWELFPQQHETLLK